MKTLAIKCNFTFVTCNCHPSPPLLPKNALPNISKHLQLLLMACSQELCCVLLQHFLSSKFKLCLSFLLLRQQLVLNQMQPNCFFLTNPLSIYHVSSESAEKESVVNNVSSSPLTNHFVNSLSTLLYITSRNHRQQTQRKGKLTASNRLWEFGQEEMVFEEEEMMV